MRALLTISFLTRILPSRGFVGVRSACTPRWRPMSATPVEISPDTHGTVALRSFDDLELDERLRRNLVDAGLSRPTPIQAHTAPLLARGDDVMASAQTGSGKVRPHVRGGMPHRISSHSQKRRGTYRYRRISI